MPGAVAFSGLLCSTAVALTSLCLFAGSREGFLDDFAVITLKTTGPDASLFRRQSNGHPLRRLESVYSEDGVPSRTAMDQPINIDTTANVEIPRKTISNHLESAWPEDEGRMARVSPLHDFYSVHLLNFCQGDLVTDPSADAATHDANTATHVTSCSSLSMSSSLNLTKMLGGQMSTFGEHLQGFGGLEEINKDLTTLQSARHAMLVLFSATIISTALSVAVILGTSTILPTKLGTFPMIVIILLETISTWSLGLASALLTLVVFKASELINSWGGAFGLSCTRGTRIVILTWSAWLAVLAATVVMLFLSRCGRRLGL